MRRLFIGNFNFEHELADAAVNSHDTPSLQQRLDQSGTRRSSVPQRSTQRGVQIATNLSSVWQAIAEPDDVIVTDATFNSFDSANLADCLVVPWGWSTPVLERVQQLGCRAEHPPLKAVEQVNRRSTRLVLEHQLGFALPGAQLVANTSMAFECVGALCRRVGPNARWVLKAEFGMSGREQWRGLGEVLAEP